VKNAEQPLETGRNSISTNSVARQHMYVIYFSARCAGVTDMSLKSICPAVKNVADIGVRDIAAPAKKDHRLVALNTCSNNKLVF